MCQNTRIKVSLTFSRDILRLADALICYLGVSLVLGWDKIKRNKITRRAREKEKLAASINVFCR